MFEVSQRVNDAHAAEIWAVTWRKNRILSGSADGKVKLWDYELKPLREWQASALAIVSVNTNGHIGVSCAMDGQIKVWDFETGDLKYELDVGCVNGWCVRLNPVNPTQVAVSGFAGNINVYNITNGSLVSTYKTTHTAFTNCVAYSDDGQFIAYGNKDGVVSIFETASQKTVRSIEAHMAPIRSLAFSPDGKMIYTASDDMHLGIFDISRGEKIEGLSGHNSWVLSVGVSPTGNYIASGSADKKIKIWSFSDRECVATLQQHSGQVWNVAWNDLGSALVSGGDDRSLIIFKNLSQ